MNMGEIIYEKRERWLELAGELFEEALNRMRIYLTLDPRKSVSEHDCLLLQNELDQSDDSIELLLDKLRAAEAEFPHIGSKNVIPENCTDDCLLLTLVLLTISRVPGTTGFKFDIIGEICSIAGSGEPAKSLIIRNAFREGGIFRKHIHLDRRGCNIDNWRVGLLESSLSIILGEQPDEEQLALSYFHDAPDSRFKHKR
jgi:hypothetical protein